MVTKVRLEHLASYERLSAQARILELYGIEAINDAKARLCDSCECFCRGTGLPLTTDGSDCPYYVRRNGDGN